ncbi:hypothetical protein F441_07905 [Phytophthora nicotianae CJ01A1]|uniref:Uncharacterized protein n=2 Tax=Phytophthora nicotianae TaxID=4792 RepID=W2GY04_PHYNI|nr:hypothetical protein L915_07762 [Phytophthora nicotianae]ETL41271.1 hypothetical protein L916_07692 [Phytophthora nicotianae]ETP17723.1 hypothetical protein F441_07905 [Phytophthora nicotianae CJ01A1]
MGSCASRRRMQAEDRAQEKIAEFVRYAISSDLVKLREMITKGKMNPNAKDRFGMNAIHWASYVGALECIKELIKVGGSPTAIDSNGRNALHHACRKDHDEVVRYLVSTAKVDINSRSENQDTPLHKAVRGKSVKVMEMLLNLGADPNLRNEQNKTPLEELEAMMSTPMTEINRSDRVTSARLEKFEPSNAEPRPLDYRYIGLALQPIRRESNYMERTDVRSFLSRRSVTECTDHTARRSSISEEPSQWATSTSSNPYASSPESTKEHTPVHKDLHYAGERVIMAIRVKSALSDTEKLEAMRQMLQQYTASPSKKS